jgi:hypothetical protein
MVRAKVEASTAIRSSVVIALRASVVVPAFRWTTTTCCSAIPRGLAVSALCPSRRSDQEKLPPKMLAGSSLKVEGAGYNATQLRALYERALCIEPRQSLTVRAA